MFLLLPVLFAFFGLVIQGYSQPATSAAIPIVPQGKVISLWNSSGTYTNVAVQDYFELWYAADPYFYTMADTGSNVLLYADMSCCAAIELGANTVNAAGCTNLHINVYTPTGNNLTVRVVDSLGHEGNANFLVAGGVITNNGWISLNIPLSTFSPPVNLNYIKQIGFIDNNAGATIPASYYVDNVYFNAATNLVFTPPPAIPTPTNNAPTPTNTPVLSMYNSSGTYPDVTINTWHAGWSGSPGSDFVITNPPGSTVKYYPGLSYVGVEFYDPNQIDTTGLNTLHFDVWTLDGNQIGVQLVSLSPTQPATVYSSIGATQKWVSVNIPLSQFSSVNPATVLSHLQQLLWLDNGGSGIQNATFYIDNVYFYSNSVAAPVVINYPTNNAPKPTNSPATVKSMYNSSGTYTDVAIDTWYTPWSGNPGGNGDYGITNPPSPTVTSTVKRYLGMGFAGVEFATSPINTTGYNMLHVDVWTPNANQFGIQLVSLDPSTQAGQVNFFPASNTITSNKWIGLDIPLSNFTAANSSLIMTNLKQLLWIDNQSGGGAVNGNFYIDNVYFYVGPTAPPTILPPVISGGNIIMQVNSLSGTAYVLQATPALAPPTWTSIKTNAGTGGILNFTNPVTGGNEFFRIKTQ